MSPAAVDQGGEGGFAGALNRSLAMPPAEGEAAPKAAPTTPTSTTGGTLPQAGEATAGAAPATALSTPGEAASGAAAPPKVTPGPALDGSISPAPDAATASAVVPATEATPEPTMAGEQAPAATPPSPPAMPDANIGLTLPDAESGAEATGTPPAAPASLRPQEATAPAEPGEEEAAAPAEPGALVAASLPAPPQPAPNSAPVEASAMLSATSPRAELPPAPAADIAMPDAEMDGEAETEASGVPIPATPEQPKPAPASEKPGLGAGERPRPPTLTAALWHAEALGSLAVVDAGAAPLRPGEIALAAPPAAATPQPPPPAARQVASVAVALAFAPNGTGGFSLSLEPAELGRVEIRVQREGDAHSVRVTAERPETLALLQRDRHELDRNLAEAGLRVDAGGIAFSLEGHGPDGGQGETAGEGRRDGLRAQGDAGRRATLSDIEAPPPRLSRSLLDLNI